GHLMQPIHSYRPRPAKLVSQPPQKVKCCLASKTCHFCSDSDPIRRLDNGCSDDDGSGNYETYALLFVQNKADEPLSVNNNDTGGAGHWIDIQINGSFLINGNQGGTHHNFNWPHFNCLAGQKLT
ncbi:MAG TPA: hypothetical protein VI455_15110, partial [Terriglobia bacterium]